MDAPLAGIRAIELIEDGAPAQLASIGGQLADLGAELIRVEQPGGAADRGALPTADGVSLMFAALNRGKHAAALDLGSDASLESLYELLGTATILIEATRPGSAAAIRLDVAGLRRRFPSLVILSISPFGAGGAFSQWKATDPVLQALSGGLSRSGLPGRPPLLPPGEIALDCACGQAVFAVLLATLHRLKTGQGEHLDLALLDAAALALDPGYGIGGSATLGVPASKLPPGRVDARHMYPIFPCQDGYVRICLLAPRQWQSMFTWMGRPAEFADPSFNKTSVRFKTPSLMQAIGAFFAGRTRADVETDGQRHGVPVAALLDVAEAMQSEQAKFRKAFIPVVVAPGVEAMLPAGIMEIDGVRASADGGLPTLETMQTMLNRKVQPLPAAFPATGDRPLSGLRVLDLGVIVVGAEQGRLMADQGAEVIKLETASFPDGGRSAPEGMPITAGAAAGHRNKLSLGLNLRHPKGVDLFRRLIEQVDVVFSNFRPGTLEGLGLGYDVLSQLNPRLIMVDSSAFGPTGPWSRRGGYGPLVRAASGLTQQWRYQGEPDSFSDTVTVYPDHLAARTGVCGALALLIRRQRTARGGTVSVSQSEVMLANMAAEIAAQEAQGAGQAVIHLMRDAPWGVFACAGEDQWCVVTIDGDAQWSALCDAIGRADLAGDPDLATVQGRTGQRARIDAALTAWLEAFSPDMAMSLLQQAGVPAGAMLRVAELPQDDRFRVRDVFRMVRHPYIEDPYPVEARPVRANNLADPPERAAPLPGEDTAYVMTKLIGLSSSEIARLSAANVLEPSTQQEQHERSTIQVDG